MLAFTEGLLSANHLTFFFLYTKHFALDLVTYSILETTFMILHCASPVYGYISDKYPLFGKKKKSYLIILGFICSLGYTLCGLYDKLHLSIGTIFIINFFIEMSNAVRTVLVDSLCVILHNIYKFGIHHDDVQSSGSSVGLLFSSRLLGKILALGIFGMIYSQIGVRCKIISLFSPRGVYFYWIHYCVLSYRANTFA